MQRTHQPSSFLKSFLLAIITTSMTLLAIPALTEVPVTITQQGRLLEDDRQSGFAL